MIAVRILVKRGTDVDMLSALANTSLFRGRLQLAPAVRDMLTYTTVILSGQFTNSEDLESISSASNFFSVRFRLEDTLGRGRDRAPLAFRYLLLIIMEKRCRPVRSVV